MCDCTGPSTHWFVDGIISVLCFEVLEETFIDLVHKFSTLVRDEDLCAAISKQK